MATEKKTMVLKQNVGDQVIARVEELNNVGFTMPRDYSYVNAIKASLLVLQDLKDKDKKPALEVCTPVSVSKALFEMATKGLDASKKTCYFLVRGNQLCMHESYFGKVLQVKRIYPDFDPHPVVIHEGDQFVYEIDPETGCKRIVKHEQELSNIDNDFLGAYMYLPTAKGGQDLYVMSRKQILTAWSKSSSFKQTVHNEFREKMVIKTIINSGCNLIINSTPDLAFASEDVGANQQEETNDKQIAEVAQEEFDEAEVVEEAPSGVDTSTGEVKDEKQEEEDF